MKILITGGAGFIGSHLCEKLLALQHRVYCLDNFCDFYDPRIKWENIRNCRISNHFTLLEGDIRDSRFLEDIFSRHEFDLIIHLAAMAGVRPSIENPRLYYDVNITGTFNLLQHAVEQSPQSIPFIFASSSSVYGNNKKVPFAEEDQVDNPISPYAVTKKAGELMCYNYYHLYRLPVICLRFFTVYGPRQRPDLAIHKFARKIIKGEPIPVFGDGTTKRDYTYIDDIIQGVVKAIDYLCLSPEKKEGDSPQTTYGIFNLGESKTIALSQMISVIEECLGKQANKKILPRQPGDVEQTYASIAKSKRLLGYNPTFSFKKGVSLFVEWLENQR